MNAVTRLYTQFQPKNYDVTFDIDEKAMRFSGSVTIMGKKVGRPSKRITLHQHKLKITSATITKSDKKGVQEHAVQRIHHHGTFNEVRLHTKEMLYPGEYTLTLTFEAPITTGMTGIYPCFFKDGKASKQLIATQFESHHAREAFPCIDEPEAKAVFNLTLITRSDVTALANTPIKKQQVKNGQLVTNFEPTPKMSSYLLAFVIGDLHSKSVTTNRGTEVSVWATTAQPAESFDFALDVAKKSIEFFEDYFDIPYPLSKADHVALPDFSSGAMENWGLITYRERVLLAYPNETAQSVFEQIAMTVSHETSHQWFGNLVTMRWWDDLWLNESFANMMEYQALDSIFPQWHIWDNFVANEGLSALRRDAVAGVQAVKSEVHHPDEISSLFDPSIVYAKGGRLLYMLKNYIGEAAFRTGLKQYFEIHAYGNTVGSDLWACLSDESGKDIGAFMNPWLTRSGFPVIHVTQKGQTLLVSQEHFLDNPTKADPERFWPVPLFSNSPDVLARLDGPTSKNKLTSADYITINTGARGHYIVDYTEPDHRKSLVPHIANGTLETAERLMLLNDASMLARAGYQRYDDVLEMLSAYATESSEPVWDIIALVVGEARRFIDVDAALEDKIKPFVDKLITTQHKRLGWEGTESESAADQKLRGLVIGLGVYAENKAITTKAIQLFSAYKDTGFPLAPELRGLIFVVPIKAGDDAAFDFLLNLHDTTGNSDLQSDACSALTATRDPKRATQLLDRLKDPRLVKPQDADRWLVYLLRNRYTRDIAWNWMVTNWQWLEKTFSNDKTYDYLPRYAASCVSTREYQQKYKVLFENKVDQVMLKRNILIGFEEIENRVTWLERDLESVQNFFN